MRFILKRTIGLITLYVNDKKIKSKHFHNIQERKDIMQEWEAAFKPLQTDLVYFHLSHYYLKMNSEERNLKKLSLEPKKEVSKVNKYKQKVQTGIPKASFLIRSRSFKTGHA